MNAETFLQNFAYLAEAPGGVQRLREMVLQLAVMGRLTAQNEKDEPASELLARIANLRDQVSATGMRRKSVIVQPVTDGEAPYQIPNSWVWSRLQNIGTINPRNNAPDNLDVSFAPMSAISETYGRPPQFETRRWSEVKSGFTHFADGDVVMAKITPCFQNGKAAVIRAASNGIGAGTTELHVFRPVPETMLPEYVMLFVRSPRFVEVGVRNMTGSAGQKRVPHNYFALTPIPIPPLAEQHRIVAKVDELMALCDELETRQQARRKVHVQLNTAALDRLTSADSEAEFKASWSRVRTHFDLLYTVPENVTALRQAILQLAVQGKLVPQDPNDGPGTGVLEAISTKRTQWLAEKSIKRLKSLPAVNGAERIGVPPGWTAARLGSVIDARFPISYGVLVPGPDTPNGVPFVRVNDLDVNAPSPTPNKAIAPEIAAKYERTRLVGGEILLGVVGSIGKLGVAPATWAGANIARAVCRIMPAEQFSAEFLLLVLQSPQIQTYFKSSTRTLAQPTLNVALIEKAVVPVPPLREQRRIVERVRQLMSKCDDLEAKLAQLQANADRLTEATVAGILETA